MPTGDATIAGAVLLTGGEPYALELDGVSQNWWRISGLSTGPLYHFAFGSSGNTVDSWMQVAVFTGPTASDDSSDLLLIGTQLTGGVNELEVAVEFTVPSGEDVFISAYGGLDGNTTNLTTEDLGTPTAPVNDEPDDRLFPDMTGPDSLTFDLTGATSIKGTGYYTSYEGDPGWSLPDASRSIWYELTIPDTRHYKLVLTGTNDRIRATIYLAPSAGETAFIVAANEDADPVVLGAGQRYFLRIWEEINIDSTDSSWGSGTLDWTLPLGLGHAFPIILDGSGDEDVDFDALSVSYYLLESPTPGIWQSWFDDSANVGGSNYGVYMFADDPDQIPPETASNYSQEKAGEALVGTGQVLRFRINDAFGGYTGTLHYALRGADTPPANDDRASAIDVDLEVADDLTFDTTGAYGSYYQDAFTDDPPYSDGPRSMWWKSTVVTGIVLNGTLDADDDEAFVEVYNDDGDYFNGWYNALAAPVDAAAILPPGDYWVLVGQNPQRTALAYAIGTFTWTASPLPPNTTTLTAIPLAQRQDPAFSTGDPNTDLPLYYTIVAPKTGALNVSMPGAPAGPDRSYFIQATNLTTGAQSTANGYDGFDGYTTLKVNAGDEIRISVDSWDFGEIQWGVADYADPVKFEWSDWFDSSANPDEPDDTPGSAYGGSALDLGGGPGTYSLRFSDHAGGNHYSWSEFLVFQAFGQPDAGPYMTDTIHDVVYASEPNGSGMSTVSFIGATGLGEFMVFGSGSAPGFDFFFDIGRHETLIGSLPPVNAGHWNFEMDNDLLWWPALIHWDENGLSDLYGPASSQTSNPFRTGELLYESSVTGVVGPGYTKPYLQRLWYRLLGWDVTLPTDRNVTVKVVESLATGLNDPDSSVYHQWASVTGGSELVSVTNPTDSPKDGFGQFTSPGDWVMLFGDIGLSDDTDRTDTNYVFGIYFEVVEDIFTYEDLVTSVTGFFGTAVSDVNYGANPNFQAMEAYSFPGNYRWGKQVEPDFGLIGKLKLRMPDSSWRIVGIESDTGGRLKLQTPDLTWWMEYRTVDGDVPRHPLKLYTEGGWVVVARLTPD